MAKKQIQLRLIAIGRALGISMRQLSLSIGKSEGWVSSLEKTKGDGISSEDMSNIFETYPMVNKEFLLEGKGEPIREDADTLAELPLSYEPEADNYRELCMAYRQDLADTREDLRRQREAYFSLMEVNNQLFAELARLQAACLAAGLKIPDRDSVDTNKP